MRRIDGDEQFPTEAVVDCLLKAETEGLDLVKTYRVVRHDGLYRRFISAAAYSRGPSSQRAKARTKRRIECQGGPDIRSEGMQMMIEP
jgi:hypothetical protein